MASEESAPTDVNESKKAEEDSEVPPTNKSEEKTKEDNKEGASKMSGEEAKTPSSVDGDAVVTAVVERLRFFFSNANVRQDVFLRKLLLKDDGIVPIEVLLKFNTIKQHTTDPALVAKAAQSDRLSDRIMLTDDSLGVKRVKPFTLTAMDDNIPLSLVVGNLPTEKDDKGRDHYAVDGDAIRKLFEQYGEVALVKLRYGAKDVSNPDSDLYSTDPKGPKKGRLPRGSALVEFEDEEALKSAATEVLTKQHGLDVEPKRTLAIDGHTFSVVLLKEFMDELKKRLAEEEPAADPDNKEDAGDEEDGDASKLFHIDWKSGCVIKLQDLSATCDREALLDAVCKSLGKALDEVKELKIYVDFSRGQTHGAIRFLEPDGPIKEVLQKFETGDVEIAGKKVEGAILMEGEEETKYWNDFISFKNKQLKQRRESSGRKSYRHKKKQRRN